MNVKMTIIFYACPYHDQKIPLMLIFSRIIIDDQWSTQDGECWSISPTNSYMDIWRFCWTPSMFSWLCPHGLSTCVWFISFVFQFLYLNDIPNISGKLLGWKFTLKRPGRLHAGGADLLQGQLGPCLRPPGDSHPEKVGWWCLNHYCLVLWNMNFMTFHILGRISSQLTNSIIFQRGRSTTNQMKYPMKSITWHRKLRRRWWRRSCCRTICWLSRATNCAAWTSERSWRSSKAKPRDELIKADELRLIKRWDWDGLGHFLASMLGCIMQLPLKWTVWKVTLW